MAIQHHQYICVPDSCNGNHAAEPQSWLRASVSYAIGGWGKPAGTQRQAISPGSREETAISSAPARDLGGVHHPGTPAQHQVLTVPRTAVNTFPAQYCRGRSPDASLWERVIVKPLSRLSEGMIQER